MTGHMAAGHDTTRHDTTRHDIYKGKRLPDEYRNQQYVVDDWRGHRLSRPPRGYHWVQIGGDYALVVTRTGVITQIMVMP